MRTEKLAGYLLWRVGKWYVRRHLSARLHRHLPSRRAAAGVAVAGVGVLAAALVLLRRGAD
jgi:hypothetical protein